MTQAGQRQPRIDQPMVAVIRHLQLVSDRQCRSRAVAVGRCDRFLALVADKSRAGQQQVAIFVWPPGGGDREVPSMNRGEGPLSQSSRRRGTGRLPSAVAPRPAIDQGVSGWRNWRKRRLARGYGLAARRPCGAAAPVQARRACIRTGAGPMARPSARRRDPKRSEAAE